MLFEDKLHDIIDTLEADKMLLLPIEFAWAAVSRDAATLLDHWDPHEYHMLDSTIFLMVESIQMLKYHQPQLHPRVETLLHYHRRPLGIITDEYGKDAQRQFDIAHCIALDPYAHRIIELMAQPVCCIYLSYQNRLLGEYHHIPSAVKAKAAYIAKRHRSKRLTGLKPRAARYDDDGNLIFEDDI